MSSFIKKNNKPSITLEVTEKKKAGKKGTTVKESSSPAIVEQQDVVEEKDDLVAGTDDQATTELIHRHVNNLIVKDALRALVKYERDQFEAQQQSAKKRNLFDEQQVKSILLQVEFTRFNSTFHNVKPIRIKIPHSFHQQTEPSPDYEFNICFITKSNQKDYISRFFEHYSPPPELLQYFTQHSLLPIDYSKNITIYSINDLKQYFKDYKNRKELLKNFTHFFVDSEITLYVYNLLGKVFQQHNKYPVPIYFTKNLSSVSATLEQQKELAEGTGEAEGGGGGGDAAVALESRINLPKMIKELNKNIYFSTYLFLHSKNIQFKIGYTNMSIQQIEENIVSGLGYILKNKLQNQWKTIKCIYLRTKDSPALPIYSHVNFELYEYLQQKIREKEMKLKQKEITTGAATSVVTEEVQVGKKGKKKAAVKKVQMDVEEPPEPVIPVAKTTKKRKLDKEEPAPVQEEVIEEPPKTNKSKTTGKGKVPVVEEPVVEKKVVATEQRKKRKN